jgi:phosphoribosylformimino-5-aminoimidazole carboxamide ribonucleotide (ProFAR) isomerase
MVEVSHTAEVTAESLYEAVALGLKAIRGKDWVEGLREQFKVDVSVSDIPVRHTVEMKEFNAWLERDGGAPRDLVQRKRARKILGLPDVR